MQKFKTLEDHIALAEFAHRNQKDKAGLAYIEHPKRVLAKVQAQGGLPFVQSAAILHDVTEDTAFTTDMLIALGVPEPVVELVKLLDRGYSRTTFSFGSEADNVEDHYYFMIRKNPNALMIKLADIEDNMTPWRLSYFNEETQVRLKTKYMTARALLGV